MSDLITVEDFEFKGLTQIETADKLIEECNAWEEKLDNARVMVSIQRGRAYAYALEKLGTKVKVAERYAVSERSIKNYIDAFNGRDKLISVTGMGESALLIPADTGINKIVEIVKGKEPKQLENINSRVFNVAIKSKVYLEAQGVCNNCKTWITWDNYECDHIKPYSKGGLSVIENAQCLCRSCNRSKSNSEVVIEEMETK